MQVLPAADHRGALQEISMGTGGRIGAAFYKVSEPPPPLVPPTERRMRVDLASGMVVDDPVEVEFPLWLCAADVNGDGRDELFMGGATVNVASLAEVVGCRLVE